MRDRPHTDQVDHDPIASPSDGLAWTLAALAGAGLVLLAVALAVEFAQAGSRLHFHCDHEVGIYTGAVRGEPVFAINPYDPRCGPPEPAYTGDTRISDDR